MNKNKVLIMVMILFSVLLNLNAAIKIGVYDDKPLIFDDENGNPVGIYPDILKYVAKKEKWDIEYIHGSLAELLDLLKDNKIDLLVSVTPTNTRKKYLKFNSETVFLNWATIVTRKNDLKIKSFQDLDKKKIAVLKSDSYFDSIKNISENLGISPNYLFYNTYAEVIESFLDGETDAGIISRLFINYEDKYSNSIRNTEIIFSPTKLKFATNLKSHKHLLQTIDYYLMKMKKNPKSIYYQSIDKWTGAKNITITQSNSTKIIVIFIIIVILLTAYITYILHDERKEWRKIPEISSLPKNVNIYKLLTFATLEDLSSTGFISMDPDYKIKVMNESFSKIFNVEKEKVINQSLFDVIEINNVNKLKAIFQKNSKAINHFKNIKIKISHQDKILNITTQFIRNLDNKLLKIFCLVEDLTLTENLKSENKSLTNDLYNTLSKINQSVLITDITGKIVFSNKNFTEKFKFSNLEIENKEVYPLIFTDEYSTKNIIESNEKNEYKFETTCKTKFNEVLNTKIIVYRRKHNNKFTGYYFFINDITQNYKKNIQHEKDIENINIIKNTISDSIIFRKEINKKLTFLFVRSFGKRFLGYFLDKNAKKIEKVFNEKTEKERERLIEQTLIQLKSHNHRYFITYKLRDINNNQIDIIEKGYAILDKDKRLKYLEGIMRVNDIYED